MSANEFKFNLPLSSPQRIERNTPADKSSDIKTQVDEEVKKSIEFQILTRVVDKSATSEKSVQPLNNIFENQGINNSTAIHNNYQSISTEIKSSNSQLQVTTQNNQNFQQSQSSLSLHISKQTEAEIQQADPLAFDLDGNGLQTTGVHNGIQFDIDGDGDLDKTSFISGNDAFLAIDKNNNGLIDNGKELFGDQNGSQNGYEELKKYDSNNDYVIDNKDPVFERLRLFRVDENGNQEITNISESPIKSIALGYQSGVKAINSYDSITQSSEYETKSGEKGSSGDIMLGFTDKA